jgi:hypothetical protein
LPGRYSGELAFVHATPSREKATQIAAPRTRPAPLPALLSQDEAQAHGRFLGDLGEKAAWRDYIK